MAVMSKESTVPQQCGGESLRDSSSDGQGNAESKFSASSIKTTRPISKGAISLRLFAFSALAHLLSLDIGGITIRMDKAKG